MCSFLLTTLLLRPGSDGLRHVNHFLRFRGPDLTTFESHDDFSFVHNLLWQTGTPTPQPFRSSQNRTFALFNGEIYNYLALQQRLGAAKPYTSDGHCILDAYEQWGTEFAKHFIGEFAVAVVDARKRRVLAATDPFGIKPLYAAWNATSLGLSSYASALVRAGHAPHDVTRLAPNSVFVWSWRASGAGGHRLFELERQRSLYRFQLRQHKTTHADWVAAFEAAVKTRVAGAKRGVVVPLSGGYDSGAVHLAVLRLQVPHLALTVLGGKEEDPSNMRTIEQRVEYARTHGANLSTHRYLTISEQERRHIRGTLVRDCEPFTTRKPLYRHVTQAAPHFERAELVGTKDHNISDESAAMGTAFMCRAAREEGRLVMLSGSGADETSTDYGFNGVRLSDSSEWGGYWPDDETLSHLFPWGNFFGGTNANYLGREERVTGVYGIEGRYPFLDPMVVQEQLSLSPQLKNSVYKAAVQLYLQEHGYPVAPCVATQMPPFIRGQGCAKIGFAPTLIHGKAKARASDV